MSSTEQTVRTLRTRLQNLKAQGLADQQRRADRIREAEGMGVNCSQDPVAAVAAAVAEAQAAVDQQTAVVQEARERLEREVMTLESGAA